MNNSLVIFCTAAMLFISLWQARSVRAKYKDNDPDQFFLSKKSHSKEEYGSTQTAYFLQMATVYPFFLFGFSGMWWLGLWNTIFYAIGIVVFFLVLPRCNKGVLDLIGRSSGELQFTRFAPGVTIFLN